MGNICGKAEGSNKPYKPEPAQQPFIKPDPNRGWDQTFEKWKNSGFPLDDVNCPIPESHPDKNH